MLEVSYSQNYHLLILERLSMHIKVRSSFGSDFDINLLKVSCSKLIFLLHI